MRYEFTTETFNDACSGVYDSRDEALEAVVRAAEENGWLYSHERDMRDADPNRDSYHGQFFDHDGINVWPVFDWRVEPCEEEE